ncbi:MAG: 30S ribosomal protein S1, partial [Bacteroidia bacterium]|nr:30S ribosomal protein S1 [Bacteroidia bacterium]
MTEQDNLTNESTDSNPENTNTAVETETPTNTDAESTPEAPSAESTEPESKPSSTLDTSHRTDISSGKPVWNTPDTEFNWDGEDENIDGYTGEQRSEFEQMYEKTLTSISDHDIIEGIVIGKTNKEAVINIGYKSDGMVSLSEFRHMPDLNIGDKVDIYIESQEDKNGQLILSHAKARASKSWEMVNRSLDNNEIITGFIKCRTKGGLIADVFGIEAFLPGSQIDVKPIRDYDQYVGKTMEFKVVKINQEYKNVVVSHKVLIEQELESQKMEIISKLEKGQVLEGTVKNITSYGVFMDLGGVDGLLHITDISWGRINHPEEVLELDQKINVVILDFDGEKKRIALGLKQLTAQPWDSLDAELKVEDKIKGKVVVLTDYGAFVEIIPGVEGLIHVSEMSWSQHLRSPSDFLKVGDEVEAVVLTIDREERKMSLGLKQLIPDPWEDIAKKYVVGSKHTAKVRNFTNFGVFVELEEGVDGLIHISDLSWTKKIKHPSEFTKIGEEIEVVVLELDKEQRRLSLGHKQLEDNPWDTYETIFTEGSLHDGKVGKVTDKGAVVTLDYGVEGFAPFRHLKKENGTTAKQDEDLQFKVLEFNKENRKIILSHSRISEDANNATLSAENAEKAKAAKESKAVIDKMKSSQEKSTLGDLDALAKLKGEMEVTEREKAIENAKAMVADKEAKEKADQDAKEADEKAKKDAEAKAKKDEEAKAKAGEKAAKAKTEEKAKPAPAKKAKAEKLTEEEEAAEIEKLKANIGEASEADKDDLKKISGVGPVFEKKLNSIGIYTFEQVSKLKKAGIDAVEKIT